MVVSTGMLLVDLPLPPSANWEVRQEELVGRARMAGGNEQLRGVGGRLWTSFTVLLERPPQTCPGTALGKLYQPCEGQWGQYSVVSPTVLGMKRRL